MWGKFSIHVPRVQVWFCITQDPCLGSRFWQLSLRVQGGAPPAERPEEGGLVVCCLFRALTPADSHSPWGVHAWPHRNWILGRCPSSPGCPRPPPRAALNRPTVLGLTPCTLPAPAATHLQEGSTCEKGFRGLKHSNYC